MGPILRFRLTAMAAAQFFDLGTFGRMVDRHGIRAELNPIIASGYHMFGWPVVILMKFALVMLVASVVVLLMRASQQDGQGTLSPRLASVVTVVAVVVGVIGGVSNVLATRM